MVCNKVEAIKRLDGCAVVKVSKAVDQFSAMICLFLNVNCGKEIMLTLNTMILTGVRIYMATI